MLNKFSKIILASFLFLLLVTPIFSLAQTTDKDFAAKKGFVPCGNDRTPVVEDPVTHKQTGGDVINPCDFNYLLTMINRIMNFVLFNLVVPISAIMFCYAGFLLLFSGGNSSRKSTAKNIITNVVYGLVIAMAAWLIVHTILVTLGYTSTWNPF